MICSLRRTIPIQYLLPVVLCALSSAVAQERDPSPGSVAEAPAPLRYRRVYVPKDDYLQFIEGRGYSPPMERDEFAEKIENLERQWRASRDPGAWIESAEYSAVFADGRLTQGTAELDVMHTASGPAMLPLSPCQLALGAATWEGTEADEEALVGNDLSGKLVASVRNPGLLKFSWTLQGERNEWNETVFDLVLAPAPRNRLTVDLPADCRLLSDRGIVSKVDPQSDGSSGEPDDLQRWSVRLGGMNQLQLTVVPPEAAGRRTQLASVRQDTLYQLADDGLEVECNIELDVHREPLDVLLFLVDPELQVTSVHCEDREASWSLVNGPDDQTRQLRIRLDEPLIGGRHSLRISAVAPLHTGTMWQLPRFIAQKVVWRQGTITLAIPDSLSLRHLASEQAQQGSRTQGPGPEGTLRCGFDLFSDDGYLEVNVVRTTHELSAVVGTTIDLEPEAMTAQIVGYISCDAGQHYVLNANVPNSWIVDFIESRSSHVLQDYQFVGYQATHKQLRIRLARPLTAEEPLQLVVRAHRTPAPALRADEFRPLRLPDVEDVTRLVAISPDPGFRLDVSGDAGVTRLDPDRLPPAQTKLLEPRSGGIVFRDDQHADSMIVRVNRDEPTFIAENHVRAEVTADSLTESYRLVCEPESSSINRLLVLLSEPRSNPVDWSLKAGENGNQLLSATKLADAEVQLPQYSQGGEMWELLLRHPQDKPFEIHGIRESKLDAACQISLATFPDATSQEGWLSIASLDGKTLSTKTNAVKPVPSGLPDPDEYSATRARYRYDVSRNARVRVDHVEDAAAPARLWAWHCLLSSQLLPNGRITHEATFLLESVGASEFTFRMPPECALSNVGVDGSRVTRPLHTEPSRRYTVALPRSRRFIRVTIDYSSPKLESPLISRVPAYIPDVDIPVLDRQWTLWLAPGLQPIDQRHASSPACASKASWTERLLGPLAAGPSETPFRLFSAEHWSSLANWRTPAQPPNVYGRLFLRLLGEQYLELATRSTAADVTWRELLQSYQQRSADSEFSPRTWVDTRQLSEAGFALTSSLDDLKPGPPVQVATELLRSNEMAIVSYKDIVMLTSVDGLAHDSSCLQDTTNPAVAAAIPDSCLAAKMEGLNKWTYNDIVLLRAWIAEPPAPRAPWKRTNSISRRGVADRDWQARQLELTAEGEGSVRVIHARAVAALGWAILLMTAGLVIWFCSSRPRLLLLVILVAAMVAMVVPSTWVPLSSSLLLGSLLGGIVMAIRYLVSKPVRVSEPGGEAKPQASVAAVTSISIVALLSAYGVQSLSAQEPSPASMPGGESPIYNVIIPVDEDLEPVGSYYYLPEEFYDILLGRGKDNTWSSRQWIVRRGTYRARFKWSGQRSSVELTSLTAVYQLEFFQPRQEIEFPWDGNSRSVEILEALLSDQPIELKWNSDRTAFFLAPPGEGIAKLELVLRPTTTEKWGTRRLEFPIPRLSRAQVSLETPVDAPRIQVTSAVGESGSLVAPGKRLIELGPAQTLALQWATGSSSRVGSRRLDVEQFSWLKIRPKDHSDSVILDTKFSIRPAEGGVQRILLHADPRLRLLQSPTRWEVEVEESSASSGKPTQLAVRLPQPSDQDFTLRLRFRVLDATGLGNLPLPRVRMVDGQVQRDWLAVSVAPELEYATTASETLTTMDPAEFLAVWGEAELAPPVCYRMASAAPTWSISTRARGPDSQATQQVDVSVGHDSMRLVFNADIETSNGPLFQHRLSVPRDFRVSTVSVSADGEPVSARAEHDGSGKLTLFLDQAVTGSHHVQLQGEKGVPAFDTEIPVPVVMLQDATVSDSLAKIYRQTNVLVETGNEFSAAAPDGLKIGQFRKGFGRLVASLDIGENRTAESKGMVMRVRRNRPSVRAWLVTTLRRTDDNWDVIADYEAHMTKSAGGVVDQFRFEIPEEWTEPFSLDPAMPYEIEPLAGERRHHLLLRPELPVTDRFRVRIRGALALGENERGRTPNIVPLDVTQLDRFFVLPTQLDQQRVNWETSGLGLVSQETLPQVDVGGREHVAYKVYSRPRAVISDVQRVAGERQIGLADVHLMCQRNGWCFGIVSFQIEPAGKGTCTLELPADQELIQARVEGTPAMLTPLTPRRWQLCLASEQLPQQVSVLFRMHLPPTADSTGRNIEVPWITGINVVRTLWTVHGPRTLVPKNGSLARHHVSAAAQDAIRLRSTASHVEAAVDTVLDSPASEINAWYTPWAVRLAACDVRLSRDHLLGHDQFPVSRNAIEALYDQQKDIGERLNVATTVQDVRQHTDRFPQPADMMRFMQQEDTVSRHYVFLGTLRGMPVTFQSHQLSNWWPRLAGAAVVAMAGVALWLGVRNHRVLTWLYQWPYAVGVLAGLAWWLLAKPSLLGWGVIAVSLWGAVRFPMPSRKVGHRPNKTTGESAP